MSQHIVKFKEGPGILLVSASYLVCIEILLALMVVQGLVELLYLFYLAEYGKYPAAYFEFLE